MRDRIQIDARLVGAGLLAAAAALVVLIVTSPPEATPVLVAGSDVPAGVPVGELDLTTRDVGDAAGLVVAGSVGDLERHVLAASLDAGSPIPRSLLVAPEAGHGADLLGLDLDAAAAVHGWLRAGDVVDVYAVQDGAELLAESIPIVKADADGNSMGSGRVRLLLAVTDDIGPHLIAADEAGSIYLIRRGS